MASSYPLLFVTYSHTCKISRVLGVEKIFKKYEKTDASLCITPSDTEVCKSSSSYVERIVSSDVHKCWQSRRMCLSRWLMFESNANHEEEKWSEEHECVEIRARSDGFGIFKGWNSVFFGRVVVQIFFLMRIFSGWKVTLKNVGCFSSDFFLLLRLLFWKVYRYVYCIVWVALNIGIFDGFCFFYFFQFFTTH